MLTHGDRACRLCGYHECAPGCAGEIPEGARVIANLQAEAVHFVTQTNREPTHCWLPADAFKAAVKYIRETYWRAYDSNGIAEDARELTMHTGVGAVLVRPHEGPTAWAFREKEPAC